MNEGGQRVTSTSLAPKRERYVRMTLHAAFVLTGVVTTLLGPLLPVLSSKWSLNDSQAGYLFTAQFVGSMGGVAFSSTLMMHLGARRVLAAGFSMMALGVATLGVGTWALAAWSVLFYGTGLGLTIPTTNLLVSEANPARASAALNILNFAWVAGAVACPALVALLVPRHATGAGVLGLAGLLAGSALALARMPIQFSAKAPTRERSGSPPRRIPWRSPLTPLLGALFFLYVGTENAIGGWAASYANHFHSGAGAVWALAPSCFWAAMLVGRATAPAILHFMPDAKLVVAGLLVAALGATTLLGARTLAGVFAGASLAGLGLAPVFPITIAMLSRGFGELATRMAGSMFALAGLGGATMPWLVGFLSARFQGLRFGLIVPLIGVFIMLGANLIHARISAYH